MEKFDFRENEHVTFFWNFNNENLTGVKATVKEIEDNGVWFEFEGEEDEFFVTFPEMQLFIRQGSTTPEGTQALSVNKITAAHYGNEYPDKMKHLIKSLTEKD